jgi:signal peptidase I
VSPAQNVKTERGITKRDFVTFVLFLFGVVGIFIFRATVLDRVMVDGDSMYPTLSNSDVLWATPFSSESVERGDIVVVMMNGKKCIKRVVALPLDSVVITNGTVYVNGTAEGSDGGAGTECSLVLSENEYYVIGDNRSVSGDSRVFGSLSKDDMKGIVWIRIYPFGDAGEVRDEY